MRRVVMVLAFLLPLAGCGADKPVQAPVPTPTPSVSTPKPVTAVVVTAPKRRLLSNAFDEVRPDEKTSLTQQILTRLERRTQQMAGFRGETTARCPALQLKAMATSDCTVTYSGHTVKWLVQIGQDYKPGNWRTTYDVTPLQGVLLREAVYAAWHESNATKDLRCDTMPEIQVVKVDVPTSYRCEVLTQTANGGGFWRLAPVTMTRIGLAFF